MAKKVVRKKLELLEEKDILFEVPENWLWVRIGSVTDIVGGGTPSSSVEKYYKGGEIPWIRPADLSKYNEIYIESGAKSITELGLSKSSAKLLPPDTLLLSSRAPIGYVAIAKNEVCTNQGFKSFKPTDKFHPHYGYWYLKYSKELLDSMGTGTTFKELSGKKIATLPFPLAPLPEQQCIVNRIESLFEKIDKAEALINEAREGFEKRKEAILAKAFRGELTKKWRKEHGWSEVDFIKEINKVNAIKYFKGDVCKIQDTDLVIPSGWEVVRLGDVTTIFSGKGFKKSEYDEHGFFKLLRIQNVTYGNLIWEDCKRMPKSYAATYEKLIIKQEDIIIALNRPITNNKLKVSEVKKEDLPIMLYQRVACIRTVTNEIMREYIYLYMTSQKFKSDVSDNLSGSDQPYINIPPLAKIHIPIPPREEQEIIIELVSKFVEDEEKVDQLSKLGDEIATIKKSILAKAFRGNLGTNISDECTISIVDK